MSTTVNTMAPPSFLNKIFGSSTPAQTAQPTTAAPSTYRTDQVQVSSTPADPNNLTAGFGKKVGDMFGEMMSDLAYSMKMGDTYNLVDREFRQVDFNSDGMLNQAEFTIATLNPFEFQVADRNYDGAVNMSEYTKYRKERIEMSFRQKDMNSDRHLNLAEIGSVGRLYLANRDPRLDANLDGLVNKREYVKAQLTLGISIRDMFGF